MRRPRSPRLRGSVTQNTVRVRARESSWTAILFRLGMLLGSLLLLAIMFIMLWHNGWPQREAGRLADAGVRLTQKAQFYVKDIEVEGRQQTSRDAIFAALGVSAGAPILTFNPTQAQARIAKLPWIASVTVERILPHKILVHLVERVPLARWQHENRTVVIDAAGKELPDARAEQFPSLPLVVGVGAPAETRKLLQLLKDFPTVQSVTNAAVRVSDRRWDLHLNPNVIVRLPEQDLDIALGRLAQLIEEKKILERNVNSIDLRLPDRLILEPIQAGRKSGDNKQ